jgi:hypothetical protein
MNCNPSPLRAPCYRFSNKPNFDKGYNSDGEIGPHSFVLEEEGQQDYDEGALPTAPPVQQQQPALVAVPEETLTEVLDVLDKKREHSSHVPIAEEALLEMEQADIVVELWKRGQVVGGTKPILLDPLRLALKKKNQSARSVVLKKVRLGRQIK